MARTLKEVEKDLMAAMRDCPISKSLFDDEDVSDLMEERDKILGISTDEDEEEDDDDDVEESPEEEDDEAAE
jgi:hypothetical protein